MYVYICLSYICDSGCESAEILTQEFNYYV